MLGKGDQLGNSEGEDEDEEGEDEKFLGEWRGEC